MGSRSQRYPPYYPHLQVPPNDRAWLFLTRNQHPAPEFVASWLTIEFERVGNIIMSRKRAKNETSVANVSKAAWKGFCNVTLSNEDKTAIKANPYEEHDLWEGVARLLTAGHKIAVTFDPTTGNTQVSVTGALDICPNAGLTMVSTGKDALTALNVALYKHFDKCHGTWEDESDDGDGMS